MKAKATLLGHPIHQMLIPLPLGLFIFAAGADILYALGIVSGLTLVSFWNAVVAIVSGLVAAVFGVWDWLGIPKGTRAKRIGALHGIGNVVLVGLFAVAVITRIDNPAYAPSTFAVVLEALGLGLGVVTGWLGGELVDRLAVGVDEGASPDAPSSLSVRELSSAPLGSRPVHGAR